MKTLRKSFGRYGFIFDFGFDYTDFDLGISVTYLDPWEMKDMQMFGFWCLRLELLVIEVTLNITDKTFRRDKIRYKGNIE